ncbi:trafficking protein particle complex subunit 3-like [Artemia franciscana]|uniref:trafficking protein particle complex subunit 3-like n=1 Tax=Artemia franciscana TaxID=6661 RepID=UPI0032D9EDC7
MSKAGGRITDPKKVNGELFSLSYGALVVQMINDYENVEDVNKQLDKVGYNMGVRLIEDFLSRTGTGRCYDFRETAEKIQAGFRMYLGFAPNVVNWSPSGDEFSLIMDQNPLSEFVELPDSLTSLKYSAIICGVIRGALEMVQIEVSCWFVQDQLRGDSVNEIRVKFLKRIEDAIPAGED